MTKVYEFMLEKQGGDTTSTNAAMRHHVSKLRQQLGRCRGTDRTVKITFRGKRRRKVVQVARLNREELHCKCGSIFDLREVERVDVGGAK